jgi:hypothetical protein
MHRTINWILMLATLASIFALYAIKDGTRRLEARVHAVEHRLLPAAVRALVENRIRVEGRTTRVLEEAPA